MKIRMITYWFYNVKSPEFKNFLNKLNVEFCCYFYENESEIIKSKRLDPVYSYNGLSYYKNNNNDYPLDMRILKAMEPYEQHAMDIIWRWRRSYSTSEKYCDIKDIYYTFLSYWYSYIKKNEINLLLLTIIPHIPLTYICYALCKCLNIPVIIVNNLAFIEGEKANQFLQTGINEYDPDFDNRYNDIQRKSDNGESIILSEAMEKYFNIYNVDNSKVKRVITYNQKKVSKEKIELYVDRLKVYLKKKDISILKNKIKYQIQLKSGEKKLLREIEKYEISPDINKRFLFFPLHMQPEATTLPLGDYFENQLLAIKIVAKCLPKNVFLYVKEHPTYWIRNNNVESMRESRNIEFYKTIVSLPNVKLIRHNYNSLDLMDKSLGIITITGTAGFEGMFKKKPVIVFGNAFYKKFKYVYYVSELKECQKAIDDIMNGRNKYELKDIRCFLKAMEPYSFLMGATDQARIENGVPKLTDDDIRIMSDVIINFYNEFYGKD